MNLTLLVFLLVYVVMAAGKLPRVSLDRTGGAVVGALAMIVIGSISAQAAWAAIDYRTMGLLFGLMLVSGTFSIAGFYGWTAQRVADLPLRPEMLLAVLIVVGAVLSSILTKDVVAVAMVPLLVTLTMARKLNPVPFLLAFCFALNTGATATLIGAPQNMIVGQTLQLSFAAFLGATAIPALLALPVVWVFVVLLFRNKWQLSPHPAAPQKPAATGKGRAATLDKVETTKAVLVTAAVVAAFLFTDWPHELVALAAAGVLLISHRLPSNKLLQQVDGSLLLLIAGLFVVNAAMSATGLPQHVLGHLRAVGVNLNEPVTLYLVGAFLSDLVGNNPAVMLLVPYVDKIAHPDALTAALVLGTGFSSNLFTFGSLAGIIMVEQSALQGVKVSFGEFFRAGAPITLITMLIGAAWVWLLTSSSLW